MHKKDFVSLRDFLPSEIRQFLDTACHVKANPAAYSQALKGKSLAMIFEKPSLRTRVTFDVGMEELGGHPVYLSPAEISLGKRESVYDVAKNLERMVQGIMIRTFAHEIAEQMAQCANVPVINALTDFSHPCQAMADYLTMLEVKGRISGLKVAYVGDGNNVAHSLMFAGAQLGAHVWIATPPAFEPNLDATSWARLCCSETGGSVTLTRDPELAVTDADVVYTDVWTSMGQEAEAKQREVLFRPYQVNTHLFGCAKEDAIFLHCLPAHRGEEVTDEVIDSPRSFVFQQAENRLHAQKAIMLELMAENAAEAKRLAIEPALEVVRYRVFAGSIPMDKTALVAVGGNALIRAGEKGTIAEQLANTRRTAASIRALIELGYGLVITHGNGPQVGAQLLRSERASDVAYSQTLDVCGAASQGEIGYLLAQSLHNELLASGLNIPVVSIITQTVVSAVDPAMRNPTKPIGPFYSRVDAQEKKRALGWRIVEDAERGYRRVVPSPQPLEIVELDLILELVEHGALVVSTGGGGIPVVREGEMLRGVEAVIDKDRASAVLAAQLGVDLFAICTDTDYVYLNYKKPGQAPLRDVTMSQLEAYHRAGHFPPGNMGPKVESVLSFLRQGGREAIITSFALLPEAVMGNAGTHVLPDPVPMEDYGEVEVFTCR